MASGGGNRVIGVDGDGHEGQPARTDDPARGNGLGTDRDRRLAPPLRRVGVERPPRQPRPQRTGLKENPAAPRRHGLPRLFYWFFKMFRIHDRANPEYYWVPIRPTRWERAAAAIALIRHCAESAKRGVVGCLNLKGGASKTTTIVHLASIMAEVTRSTVILIDCNPASGTSGKRVGRSYYQTITVQKLLKFIVDKQEAHQPITAADLLELMRPTKYGVRVIAAATVSTPQTRMYEKAWDLIFEVLTTHFEYVFVDMGNDITDSGLQTIWRHWIDVLLVTSTVGIMPDSLPQMATTELTLERFGADPFAVANAIGVFSNGYPRFVDKYLAEAVELGEDGETVEARHVGPAIAIPPDRFLLSNRFYSGGVNFRSLRSRTLQGYREVLVAALVLQAQVTERKRARSPRQPQGG